MNTRILITVVVSMFVCQQVHAQDKPDVEVTELEGTWQMVSTLLCGNNHDVPDGYFWRFEGKRTYSQTSDEDWKLDSTFYLDPSAMPAAIDFDKVGGPGIYELDGDSLMICEASPGRLRPDRFESTEDYSTILWVLRRVEEDDE